MLRDFTYIEDIVQGTLLLLDRRQPAGADAVRDEIYNIGGAHPVSVNEFVAVLERTMGTVARKESLPMQPGDMPATFADVSRLERATGYRPRIGLEEGLGRFVAWYQSDKNPLRV